MRICNILPGAILIGQLVMSLLQLASAELRNVNNEEWAAAIMNYSRLTLLTCLQQLSST